MRTFGLLVLIAVTALLVGAYPPDHGQLGHHATKTVQWSTGNNQNGSITLNDSKLATTEKPLNGGRVMVTVLVSKNVTTKAPRTGKDLAKGHFHSTKLNSTSHGKVALKTHETHSKVENAAITKSDMYRKLLSKLDILTNDKDVPKANETSSLMTASNSSTLLSSANLNTATVLDVQNAPQAATPENLTLAPVEELQTPTGSTTETPAEKADTATTPAAPADATGAAGEETITSTTVASAVKEDKGAEVKKFDKTEKKSP